MISKGFLFAVDGKLAKSAHCKCVVYDYGSSILSCGTRVYGYDGGVALVCKTSTLIHNQFESDYTHNMGELK